MTNANKYYQQVLLCLKTPVFLRGYLLLAPLALYLSVFYLIPLLLVLLQSLFDPELTTEHYHALWKYPVYGKILFNTIKISFFVALLSVVLGYPLAWAIVFARPALRILLLTIVMIPFWISVLVRTYSWMIILGRYGVINKFLLWTGIISAPLELMYNRFGVYVGMVYIMLPYAVLPIQSIMHGIDKNVLRASASLGASGSQSFRHIFLPLSFSGVVSGFTLVFIISAGIFITPSLMGSPSDSMIAMSINSQLEMVNNWGFAGALSVALLVTVLLSLFICFRLFRSVSLFGYTQQNNQLASTSPSIWQLIVSTMVVRNIALIWEDLIFKLYELGDRILPRQVVLNNIGKSGVVGICILTALFLFLPVVIILPIAFSNDFIIGFPPKDIGLNLFRSCLTSSDWLDAALNSFIVALLVTSSSTLLGVLAAIGLARENLPGRQFFYASFLAPLILPGIISAVAMYFFMAKLKLIGSLASLVLAHTILAVPYVVVVMSSVLKKLDLNLEQASHSLGANGFQTFFRVTLPLIRPGILTAAIFAFIASFDELITALFLCGSHAITLPKKMWDGIRDEMDPTIAAVSAVLIILAVLLMGIVAIMENRQKKLIP